MNAIEPKVREFCARSLDPLVGSGGFDFIADLGAQMPMRTIGMLLGIPEQDQEAIRDRIDDGLRLEEGTMPDLDGSSTPTRPDAFEEYIDWRAEHPSDDLMTELLQAELRGRATATSRTLTRDEVLGYVNLIAAAGNETTTRLIGWTGKVLAEHPDQRRELAEDRSLVPNAIEELLRFEAPVTGAGPLRHQGRRAPRPGRARGQRHAAAQRLGQPRRPQVPRRRPLRHPPQDRPPPRPSATASTSASARRWPGSRAGSRSTRCCKRFPTWEVDWDNAVQARTSTVRGWEKLPVVTP